MKKLLVYSMATFALVLSVAVAVSFCYSLIAHGAGTIDWGISFILAVAFSIILPLTLKKGRTVKEG